MTSFSPRSWLKWWRSASRAARCRTRRTATRLNLEPLEERQLLATFTVTNANNSGSGSLRQAILNANNTTAADVIRFSIGQGPKDLAPSSPLPEITNPVTLDGTTQPGYLGTPLITISGHAAGPFSEGLVLRRGSSTVLALTIRSFNGHGIVLYSNFNTIEGCYIGTDPFQTFGAGNRDAGVAIENGSNNALRGNNISGNGWSGVMISGTRARYNTVGGSQGNHIGIDRNGTVAIPNGQHGVWIGNGAAGNAIIGYNGGFNLISGNNGAGVVLTGYGTSNNTVQGNFIGTDSGYGAVPNRQDGVWIGNGASDNLIGGSFAGARNVISGNNGSGVALFHDGTTRNFVQGNYIGTNKRGDAPTGNGGAGVWIAQGADFNTIGGSAGAGNVIAANYHQGVMIRDVGTTYNRVQGNFIGTNAAGTAALGNSQGVLITSGASNTTIGTFANGTGLGNLISGNREEGVALTDYALDNYVRGNWIGTNARGTGALGNNSHGVWVTRTSNWNDIGGSVPGTGNVISGNAGAGIALAGGSSGNRVWGNNIGTSVAGTDPLGNFDGVDVAEGSNGNLIGSSDLGYPVAGNLIAFNRRHGVVLRDAGTTGNSLHGNSIRSNADSGVMISNGASDNVIGGLAAGEVNVIAFNGTHGVATVAGGRNLLRGNAIYENGALGIDVDSDGVTVAHTVRLTGASTSGTNTTVEGLVIGAPNSTYTVEFFASTAADPSGFGEGERPLPGLYTISTDAAGNGYFLVTVPVTLYVVECVSATATQADGTTWEFGNCLAVVASAASLGASSGDAARALSPSAASRSVPPTLSPSREHPGVADPAPRADGASFWDPRLNGAAVDAFLQLFGDHENVEGSRSLFRPLSTLGEGMDADIFSFLDFEEDTLHTALNTA